MQLSEKIRKLFDESRKKAINPPISTFRYDTHYAAVNLYSDLPRWEKQARSIAYAMVNQDVLIEPYEKLVGRVYHRTEKPIEKEDPDFDFNDALRKNLLRSKLSSMARGNYKAFYRCKIVK